MRTFTKVTLPLMLPGLMAAALLSFALSIDDFIITTFNAGDQVRVSGKNRDDLQEVIAELKAKDFDISMSFTNYR